MNYKTFLYSDGDGYVCIRSKRKPSVETMSRSGTWVINEWDLKQKKWVMPHCPEVTWGTISKLTYLGILLEKQDKP